MTTTEQLSAAAKNAIYMREQLLEAADDILLKAGGDRHNLSFDELGILESLGWDDSRINQELGRAAQVAGTRRAAGTKADFEKDQKRVKAARKRRQEQRPAIEEQQREIVRQLKQLDDDLAEAEEAVRLRRLAREKLRRLAPCWVQAEHERQCSAVYRSYRELPSLKDRVAAINMVLGWGERPDLLDTLKLTHFRNLGPEHPCYPQRFPGQSNYHVDPDALKVYRTELAAEKEKLVPEIDRLEKERAAALEAAGNVLDHYTEE